MELIERVKFKNADENSLSIYQDSTGRFWVETKGSGTYAVEFISLEAAHAYLIEESVKYDDSATSPILDQQ